MQHDPADELHVVRHHVPLEGVAGDHDFAAQQPTARFAHRGEGLRQNVVQGHLERLDEGRLGHSELLAELRALLGVRTVVFLSLEPLHVGGQHAGALGDQAAQLGRLALQLAVRQRLQPLLVAMNRVHDRADAFQLSLELGSEDLGEPTLGHQSSIRDTARAPRCSRARHRAPDSGWSGPAARAPGSAWRRRPPPGSRPLGGWPDGAGARPRGARRPPRPPAREARPPGARRTRFPGWWTWWSSRAPGPRSRAIRPSAEWSRSRRWTSPPRRSGSACGRPAPSAIWCPMPCATTSRRAGCIANRGLMAKGWFTKIFGTQFQRELKRIRPIVDAIHSHEERLKALSDSELRGQTSKLRGLIAERTSVLAADVERLKREKHDCPDAEQRAELSQKLAVAEAAFVKALQVALNDVLPEAFATVREACRRLLGSEVVVTGHALKWDMVPYDVQLIGGIVLHQGKIAEMATGEGKTLVATLPLYLNAVAGRGAHLVTVNNYLSRRDSQWMGHLFKWLGLTVGCI